MVLYGGQSAEHDVSCISAAHVVRALDPQRYEIDAVAITPDGRWVRSAEVQRALRASPAELPATLDATGELRLRPVPLESRDPAAVAAAVAIGAPFAVDDDGRLRARDGSPR